MTELISIWAQTRNGVIGEAGGVPWPHLSEDLKFFREMTRGRSVIMGRRTWDSLPDGFRPLPERDNIVVTRDQLWWEDGTTAASSLEEAIACARGDYAFVIGGGEIYRQAMPHVSRLVVTMIDIDAQGDTHAPKIGPEWALDYAMPTVESNGIKFRWVHYKRR